MSQRPLPTPEDDHDRKILADIERVGWSVIGIEEDEHGPAYCFSVGIYHTLGQPEILLMGLKAPIAAAIINSIGDAMRAGQKFVAGQRDDSLATMPTHFVAVDKALYRKYVGYARWLYRGSDFPLLQCLWPDKKGIFPWEADYDSRFFQVQRVLGPAGSLANGWLFPDPPNQAVVGLRPVFHDGRPILLVVRDEEAGWQFLTGDPVAPADLMIVALAEVVRRDPRVAEVADLLPGYSATRSSIAGDWQRAPTKQDG